jgi:hypothetical protein
MRTRKAKRAGLHLAGENFLPQASRRTPCSFGLGFFVPSLFNCGFWAEISGGWNVALRRNDRAMAGQLFAGD